MSNSLEQDAAEALAALGEAAVAAGPGVNVFLYRIAPKTKNVTEDAYLARYDAPPSLDSIREDFGGGTFRLRLLVAGKMTGNSARFSIEGRPRFVEGEEPIRGAGAGAGDDDRVARLEAKIRELESSRGAGGMDEEVREILKTVRLEKIARAAAGTGASESPMKMLRELLDLLDMRGGDDEDETPGDPIAMIVERLLTSGALGGPLGGAAPAAPARVAIRPPAAAPQAAPAALAPPSQPRPAPPSRFSRIAELARGRAEPAIVAAGLGRCLAPFEAEILLALPPAGWIPTLRQFEITIPGPNPEAYVTAVRDALVIHYQQLAEGVIPAQGEEIDDDAGEDSPPPAEVA
ncbi:MAG TPA: hypothetical protein PKI22_08805 [Hydrogenophilus thermoluteolus]|nr:hypothetical protein [Hydrogenophilus thermoluteolus]